MSAFAAITGASNAILGTYDGKRVVASQYNIERAVRELKLEDGSIVSVEEDVRLDLSRIYGHRNVWPASYYTRPKKFPRTDEQRRARMDRYVEWKREKIREKWIRRAAITGGVYVGGILLVVILSYLHRLLFYAVLS